MYLIGSKQLTGNTVDQQMMVYDFSTNRWRTSVNVNNITFTTKWDVCVHGGEMVVANLNGSLHQMEITPVMTSYLNQKSVVMPNFTEF